MKKKDGILLDLGCGGNKQGPTWVGMDKRKLPGVDIVHDLEKFPYPIKDESVLTCVSSHVLEHLKPWLTLDIFNEVWRIMKPGGQWAISLPYAGSHGFWQDPTHINGFNETTFLYFDPEPAELQGQLNVLYHIYKPKPWKIVHSYWQSNGNLEALLEKRRIS